VTRIGATSSRRHGPRSECSAAVGIGVRRQSAGLYGFTRNPHLTIDRAAGTRLSSNPYRKVDADLMAERFESSATRRP
jgi:hypothetical protein